MYEYGERIVVRSNNEYNTPPPYSIYSAVYKH